MKVYDVAILGGGPGGYMAALTAARSGLSTCLIEKNKIGGTCLNVGCIPTKYLLTVSEKYSGLAELKKSGINIGSVTLDPRTMNSGKKKVVEQLAHGVQYLLAKNDVAIIHGTGVFVNPNEVCVEAAHETTSVLAEHFIVATGTRPAMPDVFQYDGKRVCSSDDALDWNDLPRHLVIVGGGVVGCELATIYSNLGVSVTLVEMLHQILTGFETDLVDVVASSLRESGVTIRTGIVLEQVNKQENQVAAHFNDGTVVKADRMLIATGRIANTDGIGLDRLGIRMNANKRKIAVNSGMQTNIDHIYAIGDVCDSPFDLAHTAYKEGMTAVKNILMEDEQVNYNAIPNCVYTQPEIAVVGLTQQEAKAQGIRPRIGQFKFSANGKALTLGESKGFVRIVTDAETNRIIGAQMVGPRVTDLIAELSPMVQSRSGMDALTSVVHAHPTLSEAVWEAALNATGQALHG